MNFGHNAGRQGDAAPPPSEVEQPPPPARLGVILPMAARAAWDRLGLVLAVSLTWAFVLSLPLSVERWLPRQSPPAFHLLALLLIPVTAALPTAGAFSIAHRIAAHEEAFYSHLWQDGCQMIGPAVRLILIQTIVAGVLITSCGFYLRMSFWIGRAALMVSGYALLFWAMMLIYQWPALIAQEKGVFDDPDRRAKRGAFAAVRRSFFLALGSPLYTVVLLAVLLLLSLLMAVTIVMPALLWIGTTAILSTYSMRGLLIQFRVLPPPSQETPVPDELFRLGEARTKREASK
jgi:hypothetical protein